MPHVHNRHPLQAHDHYSLRAHAPDMQPPFLANTWPLHLSSTCPHAHSRHPLQAHDCYSLRACVPRARLQAGKDPWEGPDPGPPWSTTSSRRSRLPPHARQPGMRQP